MAEKGQKKQLLLRLSPALWNEIQRWAEDDFRSINGQIEYLLSESVKKRRKGSLAAGFNGAAEEAGDVTEEVGDGAAEEADGADVEVSGTAAEPEAEGADGLRDGGGAAEEAGGA